MVPRWRLQGKYLRVEEDSSNPERLWDVAWTGKWICEALRFGWQLTLVYISIYLVSNVCIDWIELLRMGICDLNIPHYLIVRLWFEASSAFVNAVPQLLNSRRKKKNVQPNLRFVYKLAETRNIYAFDLHHIRRRRVLTTCRFLPIGTSALWFAH